METVRLKKNEEKIIVLHKAVSCRYFLDNGSRLFLILAATAAWKGIPEIEFDLEGTDSSVMFLGFFVGREDGNYDLSATARHLSPNTKSGFDLRAVMAGSSAINFKGNLVIEKAACGSRSHLAHHTLLLSKNARAFTLPSLEIKANEVKAGHAATIGKLDRESLFYLQSRGLSLHEAKQLLVNAYFETGLREVPDARIRNSLRLSLNRRLNKINFEHV